MVALPDPNNHVVVVTDDWFEDERARALRAIGFEIDQAARTVRAPFGPVARVGSSIVMRHGRALYALKGATSGTFRLALPR